MKHTLALVNQIYSQKVTVNETMHEAGNHRPYTRELLDAKEGHMSGPNVECTWHAIPRPGTAVFCASLSMRRKRGYVLQFGLKRLCGMTLSNGMSSE